MAVVTIHSEFRAQEEDICHCFHHYPSVCHEVMGPVAMVLVFLKLSFKLGFSLSSFTIIKTFLNSSLLSAITVLSFTYVRLLIFLLAVLIPACNSSSPAFLMMCSACKLNNQSDNKQPCHMLFIYYLITDILSRTFVSNITRKWNSHTLFINM